MFISLLRGVLCVPVVIFLAASHVGGQETEIPTIDYVNRPLSGTVDFGASGRQVSSEGLLSLGTLTLTSELLPGEDSNEDGIQDTFLPSFPINVSGTGYAYLDNGLLIRSSTGEDFSFTGANQSHEFDVYQVGDGGFNFDNVGLTGSTSYQNGGGETVVAYGGNWDWEASYRTIAGEEANFEREFELSPFQDSRVSPLTLESIRSGNEIDDRVNRTTSAQPQLPRERGDAGLSPLTFRLVDEQTPVIDRENTLLAVPAIEDQATPRLTIDADITGSGALLSNRQITGGVTSLGRFSVGAPVSSVERTDVVSLFSRGGDDEATRINLGSFSLDSGSVTASSDAGQDFTGGADSVDVTVTGDFTIDPSVGGLGPQSVVVNAGDSITSLENLPNENPQSSLSIGYSYSVIENNELVSSDVTYYSLEDEPGNLGDRVAIGNTARRAFDTATHTAITVSNGVLVDVNSSLETISLSDGNGVTGEGLEGEVVTASTQFDVHRKTVERAIFEATPSSTLNEGSVVTLSNDAVPDVEKIQAEVLLVREDTTGSTRWSLEGLQSLNLVAGETVDISAAFDDSGLPADSTGQLGRNYRTEVSLTFQQGVRGLRVNNVEDTSLAIVQGESTESSLRILGSRDTQETLTYVLERDDIVQATGGQTFIVAGTDFAGEGINLTNTVENTGNAQAAPNEFRVIDSLLIQQDIGEVSAEFISLDNLEDAGLSGINDDVLISDAVEINGLDGLLHVIDLSFEGAFRGELLWFEQESDQWVNAVLGNSNVDFDPTGDDSGFVNADLNGDGSLQGFLISDFLEATRFDGSYDDYLASLGDNAQPQLGAHGSDGERAWAVIDHNSGFAVASAIPEPSSLGLLTILLTAPCLRRRRSATEFIFKAM